MKVQELIEEKYKNFISFIQMKFPNNEEIEKMKNVEIKFVIHFLKSEIYPLKHDPNLLMLKLSKNYNIELSEFSNEEKEKLKKYMKFFCEMIEKIYC